MWSIDVLQEAWYLASKLHFGQKYGGKKDGEELEYISHIGSVTFEVLGAGLHDSEMDIDFAVKCAVLHDTIEDTEISYDDILLTFGYRVADGVKALSKNESFSDKRAMMLDSLSRIKKQPREVAMVKMADRICNLYSPPFYWDSERKALYREEATLILNHLSGASEYLSNRLRKRIEDYQV
jgi:(p)ppGpp synthase/HD superfamily hydrolase